MLTTEETRPVPVAETERDDASEVGRETPTEASADTGPTVTSAQIVIPAPLIVQDRDILGEGLEVAGVVVIMVVGITVDPLADVLEILMTVVTMLVADTVTGADVVALDVPTDPRPRDASTQTSKPRAFVVTEQGCEVAVETAEVMLDPIAVVVRLEPIAEVVVDDREDELPPRPSPTVALTPTGPTVTPAQITRPS